MPLQSSLKQYFWDIDLKKARPKSHPEYYIKRILELGDKKALIWLKRVFGNQKIKEVAKKKGLSKKSVNYWQILFKS
ncbi:MAG: hypothetical protein HYY87_00520 [Candidatus Levybacteria bacterium]|nr:hypothetical protein [Candidatus Levybacteria bacterium]